MFFSRWIRRYSSETLFEGVRVEYPEIVQPLKNVRTVAAIESHADQLLNDRLSYIYVLLKNKNFVKAETAFSKLWRSNYCNFREEHSVKTINAFIEAHMIAEDYKSAMQWYKHITENSLNPTLETFAIVAHFFAKTNQIDRLTTLIDRMKLYELEPTALMGDPRFQYAEERTILETLLNDLGFSTESHELDSLLLSAIADTKTTPASPSQTTPKEEEIEESLNSSDAARGIQLLAESLAKFKTATSFEDKLAMQQQLEEECQRLAVLESNMDQGNLPEYLQQLTDIPKNLMMDWHSKMVPIIEYEIKNLEKEIGRVSYEATYIECLKMLPAGQLALLAITGALRFSPSKSHDKERNTFGLFKSAEFFIEIGNMVEKEALARTMLKDSSSKDLTNRIHQLHITGQLKDKSMRAAAKRLTRMQSFLIQRMDSQWSDEIRFKVGSFLTDILVGVAKIKTQVPSESDPTIMETKEVPAFRHNVRVLGVAKKIGYIELDPALVKLILSSEAKIPPRYLPMLTPPRPWLSWNSGGYLTDQLKVSVVRTQIRDSLQQEYLECADSNGHLETVFYALDAISSIPWKINKTVLDTAIKCWKEGTDYPGIATAVPVLKPEKPDNFDDLSPDEQRKWRARWWNADREEKSRYSQRCDANYKILIANAFKNETIYFPHYVDFRGRAYPLPVHLNHIGNDLCRGLLIFANAKPLGERGLKWLKIQVSNLFGVDKVSFVDRENFANDHLEDIFDSADQPLTGKRWWLKADNPWQCLATCIELTGALRSPDPTKFMSHIPIHQDGTCNGLQHYCALGGDVVGAKLVNLIPNEKPSDIYTNVAENIKEKVAEDVAEGIELAKLIQPLISRKVVKQPVMTTTYGVTERGAAEQIFNRLREMKENHELDDSQMARCARYLTKKVFEGMKEYFGSARVLQKWLNDIARLIASSVPESELNDTERRISDWAIRNGLVPDFDPSLIPEVEESEFEKEEEFSLVNAALEEKKIEEEKKSEKEKALRTTTEKKSGHIKRSSVIWTTPLGLPVVQPYFHFKHRLCETVLQGVVFYDTKQVAPVDVSKQSTAFPPNFIHSLDASHMMMSAIACKSANVEFAAVHDSYWTHACDIDKLSVILREAFVRLHSEDIMGRLHKELSERYVLHRVPVTIKLTGIHRDEYLATFKARKVSAKSSEPAKKPVARKKKESDDPFDPSGSEPSFSKAKMSTITVWVPIIFPSVPPKGSFDLNLVKESPYFFH